MSFVEIDLRRIVNNFESARDRMDFDAIEHAMMDAQYLGVPWYKIKNIADQRARHPKLKLNDQVPMYLVAMIERGLFTDMLENG